MRQSTLTIVWCSKARVRLASMAPGLKDFTRTLTPDKAPTWALAVGMTFWTWEATFSIGQDPTCALKVKGPLVSRSHAVVSWHQVEIQAISINFHFEAERSSPENPVPEVEFQPEKGSVHPSLPMIGAAFLSHSFA